MGAETEQVIIKFNAETGELQSATRGATAALKNFDKQGKQAGTTATGLGNAASGAVPKMGRFARAAQATGAHLKTMATDMRALALSYVTFQAATQVVSGTIESIRLYNQYVAGMTVLNRQLEETTYDASSAMNTLSRATQGTITSIQLVANTNRAMQSFVASGMSAAQAFEAMETTARFAAYASVAYGDSVDQVMNKVVTGLSRGSTMILDDYAIMIDRQQIVTEGMDSMAGKTAIVNEAIRQMNDVLTRNGDVVGESITGWQRLGAQWGEFKLGWGASADAALAGPTAALDAAPEGTAGVAGQATGGVTAGFLGGILAGPIGVIATAVPSFVRMADRMDVIPDASRQNDPVIRMVLGDAPAPVTPRTPKGQMQDLWADAGKNWSSSLTRWDFRRTYSRQEDPAKETAYQAALQAEQRPMVERKADQVAAARTLEIQQNLITANHTLTEAIQDSTRATLQQEPRGAEGITDEQSQNAFLRTAAKSLERLPDLSVETDTVQYLKSMPSIEMMLRGIESRDGTDNRDESTLAIDSFLTQFTGKFRDIAEGGGIASLLGSGAGGVLSGLLTTGASTLVGGLGGIAMQGVTKIASSIGGFFSGNSKTGPEHTGPSGYDILVAKKQEEAAEAQAEAARKLEEAAMSLSATSQFQQNIYSIQQMASEYSGDAERAAQLGLLAALTPLAEGQLSYTDDEGNTKVADINAPGLETAYQEAVAGNFDIAMQYINTWLAQIGDTSGFGSVSSEAISQHPEIIAALISSMETLTGATEDNTSALLDSADLARDIEEARIRRLYAMDAGEARSEAGLWQVTQNMDAELERFASYEPVGVGLPGVTATTDEQTDEEWNTSTETSPDPTPFEINKIIATGTDEEIAEILARVTRVTPPPNIPEIQDISKVSEISEVPAYPLLDAPPPEPAYLPAIEPLQIEASLPETEYPQVPEWQIPAMDAVEIEYQQIVEPLIPIPDLPEIEYPQVPESVVPEARDISAHFKSDAPPPQSSISDIPAFAVWERNPIEPVAPNRDYEIALMRSQVDQPVVTERESYREINNRELVREMPAVQQAATKPDEIKITINVVGSRGENLATEVAKATRHGQLVIDVDAKRGTARAREMV